MGCFNLCTKEVKIKMRMHFVGLAWMICPSMMTFGKNSYGVDMARFKHLLELSFAEILANTFDFP